MDITVFLDLLARTPRNWIVIDCGGAERIRYDGEEVERWPWRHDPLTVVHATVTGRWLHPSAHLKAGEELELPKTLVAALQTAADGSAGHDAALRRMLFAATDLPIPLR